jgi:molybdate transport system permease protein
MQFDFTPFLLSFKLASVVSIILFLVALPLAWWLSQSKSRFKPILEALSAMPIVLPPTVLGFYVLYALSANSPLGAFVQNYFGVKLVFNFYGLVVASCLYSFPFMLQPLQNGFEALPKSLIEASYLCGKTSFQTLIRVALPNIKSSLMTAIVITFAHTVGEFGVVLMVGGSIPGETKVASIAIYEFVEMLDYESAHIYSAIMVAISFIVLLLVYIFNYKQKNIGFLK